MSHKHKKKYYTDPGTDPVYGLFKDGIPLATDASQFKDGELPSIADSVAPWDLISDGELITEESLRKEDEEDEAEEKRKKKKKEPLFIKFDDVFTEKNMIKAYKHARVGKKTRRQQIIYHMNHLIHLRKLYKRLDDETYKIEKLSRFKVYEPKEREVIADLFEDKIVQDVLSKHVLYPLITNKLIHDNYASQPEKGTHLALKRLQRNTDRFAKSVNWTDNGYVLVCDVKKYFYMIYQEYMWNKIDALPMDDKLKRLLKDQIEICNPEINPYTDEPGRGLCIGFQTSQWFAVYYLDPLDHFIKEQLRIKYYGRYMDDFYLIHESKEYLEECLAKIREFADKKLKLTLNEKTHIHPFKQGICFLGYHVTYDPVTHKTNTRIRPKSINKMLKRTKRQASLMKRGELTKEKGAESLQAWHAYACHGDTEKSLNAHDKAYKMLSLDRSPEEEYRELCDDWNNLDAGEFFKLNPIEGHTADDCVRDIDGFAVLFKKKRSKREVWADDMRKRVLADPKKYVQLNLEALLADPKSYRYKRKTKKNVAKKSFNCSLTSLLSM